MEMREHFGKTCCLAAMHRIVQKLGFVVEKTLRANEQGREDIKKACNEWGVFKNSIPRQHLVLLDETGLKTNMTRLYGRALSGNHGASTMYKLN